LRSRRDNPFLLTQKEEICTHDEGIDVQLRQPLENGVNFRGAACPQDLRLA
jgi:hypothetical protein